MFDNTPGNNYFDLLHVSLSQRLRTSQIDFRTLFGVQARPKMVANHSFFSPAAVSAGMQCAVCVCVDECSVSSIYTHNTHCECERVQRIDFSRAVAFPAEQQLAEFCVCERRVSRSRRKILAIQVACLASVWPAVMAALQCSLYTIRTALGTAMAWRESRQQSLPASPTLISKKALLFQRKQISAHNHRALTPF